MKKYDPKVIEKKWQKIWQEQQVYKADLNSSKPKYISMSMFNYPSGAGIHIGHAMNYTISDVLARFKRQQGFESYHPVGWDSFGLPAENYAIKAGVSPQESMAKIIPNYHKQYQAMGWSNDWSKEIATHTPEYYKWTQWIFSEMYRAGLAYQDTRLQWWCDKCQTVLANEQVIDGKCWRHDSSSDPEVVQREVKQWFFKITDYADELLEATDALDWTETVKTAQRNWIGKSTGALIKFPISNFQFPIEVFTTRPDTLFGATFLVLAPEHELVSKIVTDEQKSEVEKYRKEIAKKTELERQADKEKTGVFTGAYAINPANGEKIPVWIAEYVLSGYGTGAIMAVPAHDERDFEFAKKYNLNIQEVVAPQFGEALPDIVDVAGPVVIGYDPRSQRFMSLINKKNGMRWFAAGGLRDGEAWEQAALRELKEEAGFSNVEKLIALGGPNYSYFYNPNKNSNRRSFSYMFLAIISEQEKPDQEQEEHESYEVVWSDLESIRSDLKKEPSGRDHWLDGLARVEKAVEAYHKNESYIPALITDEGVLFNSGAYTGMSSAEAREKIVADLTAQGVAVEKVNYKMRDWSVSRQRYWGAPIPIIYCEKCGPQLVPDADLPVVLPVLKDFSPSGDGRSALARAEEWVKVKCPQCGGAAERETDTLDTYICSSWYMLRYFDPANSEKIFDSNVINKWMPIDFYNGADHATAHMLYARFVTRFFFKKGLTEHPEPFKKFLFNGKVTASDGQMFSKSKGNGVDPLEIIEQGYGADALRTYLMFAAPLELWIKWDPQGVPSALRFLNRIWSLVHEFTKSEHSTVVNEKVLRAAHKTIKKVTTDLENQKYNTAIASMMELVNILFAEKSERGFTGTDSWKFVLDSLVQLVAPFAPHMADELWEVLGHTDSAQKDHWPHWDETFIQESVATIVVQINGKMRGRLELPVGVSEEGVKVAAFADEKIKTALGNAEVKRAIFVPNKLLNLVV